MAKLIPPTSLPGSRPGAVRVFNWLKRLPERYTVIQRLPLKQSAEPDILILADGKRAVFVATSSLTVRGIKALQQPNLLGVQAVERFDMQVEARCRSLCERVSAEIPLITIYPNLPDKQLATLSPRPAVSVGKESVRGDKLTALIYQHLSDPLSHSTITELRASFTPENIVPREFTARRKIDRNLKAKLTPLLLDYRQETVLKSDLELPSGGQAMIRDFNLRLVNGIAGSGKSLLVVYRASLVRQLFPNKRILGITHNKALKLDLQRKYARISNGDSAVTWQTFYGFCRRWWPEAIEPFPKAIAAANRRHLIEQVQHKHLADTAVSPSMLMDEIDWVKDNLVFGAQQYLSADRSGRGFALGESMRRRMFKAMVDYHKRLYATGHVDWGDIPRKLWRHLLKKRVVLPQYDVVLIDEAQFFAPLWFEFVKRVIRPKTGQLFLVADPAQGFLQRKQSWLASGLDVRGRTQQLNKSYRTTHEILSFATLLYRTRLPEEDEDIVPPDLSDMPRGTPPVLIPLTSAQDEVTRIIAEIRQLLASGVPQRDILIIDAKSDHTTQLVGRLRNTFGATAARDPRDNDALHDAMRVMTLNASTGLESPIVFVIGVHKLYEREQSIRLSDAERNELIRDNTRKLYMVCTRAGHRLVLTYVGEIPSFLQLLNIPTDKPLPTIS